MADRSSPRIVLVVDDNGDLRSAIAAFLELDGRYLVVQASHGGEALEYLRRHRPPFAVLCDVMMPVMDGWEFLTRKMADRTIADVPTVVMSAGEPSGFSERARTLGAREFIRKPMTLQEILAALSRCAQPVTRKPRPRRQTPGRARSPRPSRRQEPTSSVGARGRLPRP